MKDKKKFYINGKWVDPQKKNDFNVINPSSEESCAVISLGSPEDINIAVNAAPILVKKLHEFQNSFRQRFFRFRGFLNI